MPWNNNNAEHAVKGFAYYREIADGLMTESGLTNYLTLLSIQQTCVYKGVSFLKFLLSQERDIDGFCDGGRRGRRGLPYELYPERIHPASSSGEVDRTVPTAEDPHPVHDQGQRGTSGTGTWK